MEHFHGPIVELLFAFCITLYDLNMFISLYYAAFWWVTAVYRLQQETARRKGKLKDIFSGECMVISRILAKVLS